MQTSFVLLARFLLISPKFLKWAIEDAEKALNDGMRGGNGDCDFNPLSLPVTVTRGTLEALLQNAKKTPEGTKP